MNTNKLIKIVVVSGSVRPGNYTNMAVTLILDELSKKGIFDIKYIDLATQSIPFPGKPDVSGDARLLQEAIKQATGIILATPEYHGSFSSIMKLAIENMGFPSALAGKPVALLGVAAGQIGAIKSLEHLRSVCSHAGAIVLPSLLPIAHVQKVFDTQGQCLDPMIEERIRALAVQFIDYIQGSVCPKMILESIIRDETSARSL